MPSFARCSAGLVGARDIEVPGFVEGLVVGGAVGTGYAFGRRSRLVEAWQRRAAGAGPRLP